MSDRFTPETFTEAYWNAEWEAMSQAQRECLVAFVDAAKKHGKSELWGSELPRFSFKVFGSKALRPYLDWCDHQANISDDAFALVAHARKHFIFPKWRYLRYVVGGDVVSIVQTQDSAFADGLLAQGGWAEISDRYFKSMAQYLSRIHNGERKVPVNTKGS